MREPAVLTHVVEDIQAVVDAADSVEDDDEEDDEVGEEHHDPVLVGEQRLDGDPEAGTVVGLFLALLLGRLVMHTLLGGEDADQGEDNHRNAEDQHREGEGLLGIGVGGVGGELGQQRHEDGVDDDVAEGLENLLDVAQKPALIGVSRNKRDHGVEGHQHGGQTDGVDDVVHDEHIHILDRVRPVLRDEEKQHDRDGEGDAHAEEPAAALAHFGLGVVHQAADDHVGDAVKDLGDRDDRGDDGGVQERDVGEVNREEGAENAVDCVDAELTGAKADAFYPA